MHALLTMLKYNFKLEIISMLLLKLLSNSLLACLAHAENYLFNKKEHLDIN